MKRNPSSRVVELPVEAGGEAGLREVEESPLYGVAMLKIAMELKKPNAAALEEIVSGVLAKMHLSEEIFRQYLEQNGGLLRTIARQRKY